MPRSALAARRSIGRGLATAVGGAAGNGLLNNLVAYWALDEAAGANDALDKHTNGLTLTQSGSPGSAAGKISTARTFDSSGAQHLYRADNALLSLNGVDFTITAWVNLASKSANRAIVSKWVLTGNKEYILQFFSGSKRFRMLVYPDGATPKIIAADTFGEPSLSTWYFLCAQYNSTAQTLSISVNSGAFDALPSVTGVIDGACQFQIGKLGDYLGESWLGNIDEVGVWKSAAGLGGILTAAQIVALYNAGAGLAYSAFTT